jgi:hypothetical protein
MFRAVLVTDEEAGVEEEVELWDDEGGVPCGTGAANEGEGMERGRWLVFENGRICGLGERRCKG